ncbi:MAG: helix-turn-helix transcriptional regulator [Deltaproteobacteria bacterium]|nr:helix-turn-helix transcriptional regulator [Deltaproteobacteria bacterium]
MSDELLNTKEVARYLGIHEKQVYALIKAQRIPATRLTGKWVFPKKLLDEWIEADARRGLAQARQRSQRIDGAILAAGSDDPVLSLLAGALRRVDPGLVLFMAAVGSTEGLKALNRGYTDVAFSHLLDPETGEYNLPLLPKLVPDKPSAALNVFHREIGFVVAKGNPKGIHRVADLRKKTVRIVNRQLGSGTRVLLDGELSAAGIDAKRIAGYEMEVCTHHEVALAVHSGEADVGIAASSAARLLDLGFVGLREERFDMVVDRAAFFERRIQSLIDLLGSGPFRAQVSRLGGYDFRDCGKVLTREP